MTASEAKNYTQQLLQHYPFTYCPTLAAKTTNHTPHKGDVVLFCYSGEFTHTGYVYATDSTYFYTIEGNTSGASGIVANGGGVCKKTYRTSSYSSSKFFRPNYSLLVSAGIFSSTDVAINKIISVANNEVGYLEKRSNSNLDDKTANAGSANYTKYWRDIYPGLQAQPWCACFVTWIIQKAIEAGQTGTVTTTPVTTTPSTGSTNGTKTTYANVTSKVSTYGNKKKWSNGSTSEKVYGDLNKTVSVGELDPYDSAVVIGKTGNMYIICYNIEGSSNCKVGFVEYDGESSYSGLTKKTWKNGSTAETTFKDTNLSLELGELDPKESCACLGKINSRYIVLYQVGSTSNYKVGVVEYNGGL